MPVIPSVVERTPRGERGWDLYSRLLQERVIMLAAPIDDDVASSIVAQLLYLQHQDSKRDIWFYINVRLNFDRLLRETRMVKLVQQLTWLRYVATKTAPDNALILYFYEYLRMRVTGDYDLSAVAQRLKDSSYWREKFAVLGLNATGLPHEMRLAA